MSKIAIPPSGEVIGAANLAETSDWKSDGDMQSDFTEDGLLQINNGTRSVYWVDRVFKSPVMFDFEMRTPDKNTRAILFFMAEGINGEDIFSWDRPLSDYGD